MRRNWSQALSAFAVLVIIGCASEPFEPDNGEPVEDIDYRLVWSDEFSGATDQLPDDSKWTFDVGGGGWGNNQLEYDTARAENVSLDGLGHLRIIAREENFGGRDYTSGRIKTQGLYTTTYGRIAARIKLPVGQGLWPAFWMLGADFENVGWPDCGEIDIMEYRGQAPNIANGALHGPGYSGGQPLYGSYTKPGAGFHESYNVFAVEWTRNSVTWYVNDTAFMTKTTRNLPSGADWVFDHPFFILLNVAVGGNYVGDPSPLTQFPQTMLVDWIRVYEAE